jgi:hypothetical protein
LKFNDTNIAVELPEILAYLDVDHQKQSFIREAEKAYQLACSLVQPGVIYRKHAVKRDVSPTFFIGDVEFNNKAIYYNLSDSHECFVYIITVGTEFSMKANDASEYLGSYYLDKIGNFFLRRLREKLIDHLGARGLSRMSPGSTHLWPLTDNRKIFATLGDEATKIGVSLSDSHVMVPFKTVSGILFYKEKPFFDCFLCQLTDCQARQAGYNPQIAEFYQRL